MNEAEFLCAAGETLYGSRWQTDMAADLKVSDRTVRRWVSRTETPRPGVLDDLRKLLAARRERIDTLLIESV